MSYTFFMFTILKHFCTDNKLFYFIKKKLSLVNSNYGTNLSYLKIKKNLYAYNITQYNYTIFKNIPLTLVNSFLNMITYKSYLTMFILTNNFFLIDIFEIVKK